MISSGISNKYFWNNVEILVIYIYDNIHICDMTVELDFVWPSQNYMIHGALVKLFAISYKMCDM